MTAVQNIIFHFAQPRSSYIRTHYRMVEVHVNLACSNIVELFQCCSKITPLFMAEMKDLYLRIRLRVRERVYL